MLERVKELLCPSVHEGNGKKMHTTESIELKQADEERTRLLAQIQEQAQQMQQIVDTVPEGMLLLDNDGRIILNNPLGEKVLVTLAGANVGDTLTHLGGRPLVEFLTSPPKGLWHDVAADGRNFQVIARPIENSSTPGRWVMVIRDVTQQLEVERRLQQQERLASVGQLAAGIAHDFNNITAVIALYARMGLQTADIPATMRERLEIIDEQVWRANELIQQILDFSRHAALERCPMDLCIFLKEQVKLLERTLPESIEIDLMYSRNEYIVNADPTRLQQVIMNLAVNARDAMPKGGQLHIGLDGIRVPNRKRAPLPEMEAGDWVCVTVTDTGTGIPPDALPHIFEPFFTTKSTGGTGLGLAQVWGIVKQHDGHIDVSTIMGKGTTFKFYIPALQISRPETLARETKPLIQGQGETILVVEDAHPTRAAIVAGLEMLNYRVLAAANGREALSIFERHAEEIALVLSDRVMPEMGGIALLHTLREKGWTGKAIILTGHLVYEKEKWNPQPENEVGWLQKPVSLEELSETLARALSS